MSRRRIGGVLGAALALAAVVFLLPAAADWLVTEDGARVETDGPWEVKDRLVIFKRPDGTYASIRRSEVDLEESERLTLEMAERESLPRPREESGREERREPVARLTEKELPPVRSRPGLDQEPDESPDEPTAGERRASSGLAITTWREVTEVDSQGVGFTGEIRNPTEFMAIGVQVRVTLFDEQDEEIVSSQAVLTADALPPGRTASFRATFDSVYTYDRADFDISGNLLRTGSGQEQQENGVEADQEAEG